jgi:hypothetical protein
MGDKLIYCALKPFCLVFDNNDNVNKKDSDNDIVHTF